MTATLVTIGIIIVVVLSILGFNKVYNITIKENDDHDDGTFRGTNSPETRGEG